MWGDYTWIGRFVHGTPLEKDYPENPAGLDLYEDWLELKIARAAMDDDIKVWAAMLRREWLENDFTWYSGMTKSTHIKPAWLLVTHLFNHQTHHRGQVTTLLSQQGIDPGITDVILMPD